MDIGKGVGVKYQRGSYEYYKKEDYLRIDEDL